MFKIIPSPHAKCRMVQILFVPVTRCVKAYWVILLLLYGLRYFFEINTNLITISNSRKNLRVKIINVCFTLVIIRKIRLLHITLHTHTHKHTYTRTRTQCLWVISTKHLVKMLSFNWYAQGVIQDSIQGETDDDNGCPQLSGYMIVQREVEYNSLSVFYVMVRRYCCL